MFGFPLRARSLARIKASASGAENPGFKSQRARLQLQSTMFVFLTRIRIDKVKAITSEIIPASVISLAIFKLTYKLAQLLIFFKIPKTDLFALFPMLK